MVKLAVVLPLGTATVIKGGCQVPATCADPFIAVQVAPVDGVGVDK